MDKKILRELLKNLQIIMRCPHCGKPYNLDEINLNGQTYTLKMQCSNCNLPVNASVTVNDSRAATQMPNLFGFNKINLNREITPPATYKSNKLKKEFKKPISADELIDFHKFIKNFDGRLDKII
jgi:hypothetical protein